LAEAIILLEEDTFAATAHGTRASKLSTWLDLASVAGHTPPSLLTTTLARAVCASAVGFISYCPPHRLRQCTLGATNPYGSEGPPPTRRQIVFLSQDPVAFELHVSFLHQGYMSQRLIRSIEFGFHLLQLCRTGPIDCFMCYEDELYSYLTRIDHDEFHDEAEEFLSACVDVMLEEVWRVAPELAIAGRHQVIADGGQAPPPEGSFNRYGH